MKNTETAGGTRFNAGKPGGWWYAPILGLRLVAPVWMQGAEKYAPKDWRVGQSFSVLIDCAFRHMLELVDKGPTARCPESGNLHAAHAVWNLLCMLTLMVLGRDDCDDVTKWEGVTTAMKAEMEELEELVDGVTVDDVSEAAKVLEGGGVPLIGRTLIPLPFEVVENVLTDVGAQLLKPVLVEQLQKKSTEALEEFGKAVRDHIGPPLDISKLKEGTHPAMRGDPATLPSWEPAPELKPLAEESIKDAVDKIEGAYELKGPWSPGKTDHMWEGAPVLADLDPTAKMGRTPEPTPREMARGEFDVRRCHICYKPVSECQFQGRSK